MTLRRTALWCGAGLAALLGVVALTVALAVYRPQLVRPWVQRALTPRGGTASLAGLRLSLTPPALELSGLAIAGPPREGDLLRLDHLQFELIPRRFFFGGGPWLRHVEVRGLVFERPRPRETKGPPDLTPITRLFDIEDLSLTDARLRVALPQGDLAADRVRLSLIPGEGGIRAFSGYGELTFRRQESTIVEGKLTARGNVTPGPAIEVDLELASETLGRLTGELAFRGGSFSGHLDGASLPADNLISLARTLSGQGLKGWAPTGAIDVAARLEPAVSGSRVTATATFAQIGFSSPAGDVMGQNLAGRVDLEALLIPQPRMKADLILRRGEALWGTVYVDLAKDPLDLHAGGTRVGPEEYKDLALEGGLAEFGRLSIEGKARHAGGIWRHQGRLVLSDARLGAIFRTFLRDPLAAKHRDLAGLEMGGAAEVDLSFSGSGQAADLSGTLRLRSSDVRRGAEPPLLSGLDIDLPIAYSLGAVNPGLSRPPDAAKWGRLSLKKLRLAGQELGPLEMPAVLVPNHLYLGGAIDASLFGAKLSLRRIQVDEPLSPGFLIKMAAQLDGLDLARAAGDNSILKGHVGGLLDPVAIGRERMTATGELTGDLFGGRLDIRHVTAERPFGAGREIGADVNVSLVDLERFSAALGVGRITGRLSGSLEGLRVAYGQPVAFHIKMESVPTKGVSQSVSLKAVNSISLVSTGSTLSGLGVSLVTTFFKEFPYEKIGFECNLKNDVFTVRGLIHEDGVEYLVKRSLFTGINVINANPDNRIGFTDMLDRAKRVTSERSH